MWQLGFAMTIVHMLALGEPLAQSAEPATPSATSQPSAVTSQPVSTRPAAGFLFKTVDLDGEAFNYSIYVPPEYSPSKAWPVILFLHGSGERGGDGMLQTEVGIATAIRRVRARCPAIVVMPQCRAGERWFGKMNHMALKCLEATSREYNLDPARVYLTGLSLGGEGAWLIASDFPREFAAVAVVCGFVGSPQQPPTPQTVATIAGKLNATPVWIYHGSADKAVNVEHARRFAEAIKAAGGNVGFTEFPNLEHNVWDRVYASAEFWNWLLSQERK
ncbi:MAG: alpha/beta hydrolase-fold protein [Phycisphaerae bacterium]